MPTTHKVGEQKTLSNGSVGEWIRDSKGHVVFRIKQGSTADYMRTVVLPAKDRPITLAEAQKRLKQAYGNNCNRMPTVRGQPRFKSKRGCRQSLTYHKNHAASNLNETATARYTGAGVFHRFYKGLQHDEKRAPPSLKQLAARDKAQRALANYSEAHGRPWRGSGSGSGSGSPVNEANRRAMIEAQQNAAARLQRQATQKAEKQKAENRAKMLRNYEMAHARS